mmetsp:Transcript_36259/g.112793  ORF Transcript_36259/g.112793 Transcript_36259/m.112793 type:complete len:249 (-) Transcript_36259:263-1009(-)
MRGGRPSAQTSSGSCRRPWPASSAGEARTHRALPAPSGPCRSPGSWRSAQRPDSAAASGRTTRSRRACPASKRSTCWRRSPRSPGLTTSRAGTSGPAGPPPSRPSRWAWCRAGTGPRSAPGRWPTGPASRSSRRASSAGTGTPASPTRPCSSTATTRRACTQTPTTRGPVTSWGLETTVEGSCGSTTQRAPSRWRCARTCVALLGPKWATSSLAGLSTSGTSWSPLTAGSPTRCFPSTESVCRWCGSP